MLPIKRYEVKQVGFHFQVVDRTNGKISREFRDQLSANSSALYLNNQWLKNRE